MKTQSLVPGHESSSHSISDRSLAIRLHQGDLTALSSVYDRYSRLVFHIVQQAVPSLADVLVEDVFLDLWCVSTHALLTPPLLGPLLDLTTAAVMRHGTQGPSGGEDILARLAPFNGLSARAFEVCVLRCLGQLSVEDIASALEQPPAMIRATLTAGMATLRKDCAGAQHVEDGAA